jgi:hypothetical protein
MTEIQNPKQKKQSLCLRPIGPTLRPVCPTGRKRARRELVWNLEFEIYL